MFIIHVCIMSLMYNVNNKCLYYVLMYNVYNKCLCNMYIVYNKCFYNVLSTKDKPSIAICAALTLASKSMFLFTRNLIIAPETHVRFRWKA